MRSLLLQQEEQNLPWPGLPATRIYKESIALMYSKVVWGYNTNTDAFLYRGVQRIYIP